jgi:RNA polymerase sigma-70 factor (ECF subfamily)
VDDLDQLVAAARSGGSWAFGRLWEQLSPTVAGYLRARGARDADDTTSEVFLAAFRGIGSFEGDGRDFRAWLFTIAHHKGVDAVRRSAGAKETPTERLEDGRACPSAEDDALVRLGGEEVHQLIGALSPDQRAVLLLRIVGGLTLAETATVLGKPVGAVKSLQHRGLGALRRALATGPVSLGPVETIAVPR